MKYQKKCTLHLHRLYKWKWKWKKKNYLQVYLEECKYKIRKIKISKFINTELESGLGSELGSDTELESELESNSE